MWRVAASAVGPSSLNAGITRATFQASQKAKRCRVRIALCRDLHKMLKEKEKEEEEAKKEAPKKQSQAAPKRRKSIQTDVLNVNPDWDATSVAVSQCVVCQATIKKSPLCHYIQKHGEHFAARLPPGMLDELRAGRSQRPDYCIAQGAFHLYHFRCPFCVKVVKMRSQNLAEHLINHTGERRYQCSHCLLSLQRMHMMMDHIKKCDPEAQIISLDNCGLLPMSLLVCELCQFVQVSREHMDRHMVQQHGMKEDDAQGLEHERVLLCTIEDVPKVRSVAEAQELLKRKENPESKATKSKAKANARAKALLLSSNTPATDEDDDRPSTSKAAAARRKAPTKNKVKIRFQNMAKKSILRVKREREEQAKEQQSPEQPASAPQEAVAPSPQASTSEAGSAIQTKLELPLPPPERESLLVVNECLMDQEMDQELEELAEEELALQNKDQSMLVDEKPIVLMEVEQEQEPEVQVDVEEPEPEPEVDVEASPEPVEKEKEAPAPAPAPAAAAAKATPSKPLTLLNPELSLSALDADLLDGIGSDASDADVDVDVVGDTDSIFGDDDLADEPLTDEWIDLETAERNRKAKNKNPFQVFTSFCSRLNKSSGRSGRSWPSNTSSSGGEGSNNGSPPPQPPPQPPLDPSELMPRMRPLEPETAKTPPKEAVATPSASASATASTSPKSPARKSPLKRVENVAYRKWSSPSSAAYYCIYPGCTFLFSNELEGLENHFARDHPLVRWSGACAICPRSRKSGQALLTFTIAEELRHMTEAHMKEFSLQSETTPEVAPEPAAPVFKLRVRRFSGDRLTEPAEAAAGAAAPVTAPVTAPLPALTGEANGMLRDLLQADPRPPNQVDFNAAGLGEFLCAKPTTPPQEQQAAIDQPVVINYPSGLGLAISQVFNGASVPMPVLGSPSVAPAPAPAPGEGSPATAPIVEDRIRPVADRFRCMAVGCGFCSHTVLCIREHMKFHRYGFGSTGYLRCAYCNHIATDVDDYLRHGVVVHSLATKSDLIEALESSSVSQQIRDMLNQRGSVTIRSVPPANPAPPAASVDAPPAANAPNAGPGAGPAAGAAEAAVPDVSLPTAVSELLRPTGYSGE